MVRRVGLTDSLKIMVTNAYQLLTGSKGVDGAPVADVGKYNVRFDVWMVVVVVCCVVFWCVVCVWWGEGEGGFLFINVLRIYQSLSPPPSFSLQPPHHHQ